jgi:hypothetical protein
VSECPSVTVTVLVSLVFIVPLLAAHAFMIVRNSRVHVYRREMIEHISTVCLREIHSGLSYSEWRWREFDAVSYDAMLWCVWRRLDSFYKRDPARLER